MNVNRSGPLRILAVEDSADALQMLCELLRLIGHEPTGASDAAGALELLSARQFDVLLTDVNLPGQSGVQLARAAKAFAPELNVIFASGHDQAMLSQIGFPAAWLTKPYDYAELTDALEFNRSGSV